MQKILPTILILINVLSAIVYAFNGDWRKTIYWLAAATLTTVITY